jgi:hypothetical protein
MFMIALAHRPSGRHPANQVIRLHFPPACPSCVPESDPGTCWTTRTGGWASGAGGGAADGAAREDRSRLNVTSGSKLSTPTLRLTYVLERQGIEAVKETFS